MRRFWSLSILLIGTLLATGCSDQITEVSPPDMMEVPGAASVALGCVPTPTAASLLTMVNGLLPSSPLRTSLIILIGALPTRAQDRIKVAVRRLIFPIQDLVLRSFYAGRLSGGTSTATYNKVLRFIEALYCYVGLTPPDFPSTTAGEDIVVAVLFPNSPTTNVVVPSGHGAVRVPNGSVPTGGVTLVVRKLPDGPPGPLNTTLDQFPFFYDFTGMTPAGPVTFNSDVITGICPRDDLSEIQASLRLAHNVGTAFGTAEVLPAASVGNIGLNCIDLPQVGSAGTLQGWFASNGWMGRTLRPIGRALLPQPLFAASLATVGVGGTTRKFSPFGIVDIGSNPANLDFNPNAGAFDDLIGIPGGSVTAPSVRLTTQNGDPVANWPVTFAPTAGGGIINGGTVPVTVTTGANGIASLASWVLGNALVQTVTATPTPVSQLPASPSASQAFQPAGAFSPTSRTFTATTAGEIDYLTEGYRYLISNTDRVFPQSVTDFDEPGYNDSGWPTGDAAFGFNVPSDACSLIAAEGNVNVTWPSGTDILLRRPFTIDEETNDATIRVAIDNDIRVFVNGTEITATGGSVNDAGFVTHDGCPTLDSRTFYAVDLIQPGINWLAIQARDRASSTYVDVEISAGLPID